MSAHPIVPARRAFCAEMLEPRVLLSRSPGTLEDIRDFANLGDWALFSANDGVHGDELYRSNGGTREAKTFANADIISLSYFDYAAGTRTLYFVVEQEVIGRQLWRSNGTLQGTYVVGPPA
jgi:ELWxxDGT repeat protein